ncbi:hypothetical protein NPIL_283911 [Nephila pilipes]|uniref:Uncharacterized protein n=1 Tax=Nephila pilipes TaxID=299642 RepID=A0A8X6JT63_NEPPI|nr:hypothetical protein NPIL_283911 [Nephila pilipes]
MSSQKPKLKDKSSNLHFKNIIAEQRLEPARTNEKEIDSLQSEQPHTHIGMVKEEKGGIIGEYTIHQSTGLELKSTSRENESKRKSLNTALKSMEQQMYLHSSKDDNPIYKNILIGALDPEYLNKEKLVLSGKTNKFQDRSERRNPKCSVSLHGGEEINSLCRRNQEQKKECYYSVEDSSIFENVCSGEGSPEIIDYENLCSKRKTPNLQAYKELGEQSGSASASFEWSSEIVDYENLLSKRKNSKSLTRKELSEPTFSTLFENIQPESIYALRVNLPPESLNPTGCKLDEGTKTHSQRLFMDNIIMLPNVPPHTTGMSLPRLRLGRRFRVIRNKVAKLFDRKK